ncbi:TonB-dependent receptor [Ravibacter arvi]|uniref:TonB-dependent receptor n=1 Tax=Ravibacter arvi TaxID=2051041 RepID=A0ABP8LVY5_9BACT
MSNREIIQKGILKITHISLYQVLILFLFASFAVAGSAGAQRQILEQRVSVRLSSETIESALKKLERTANIRFMYNPVIFPAKTELSLTARNEPLGTLLTRLLMPYEIDYEVSDQHIILKRSRSKPIPKERKTGSADRTIRGRVSDESGGQLPGVSIVVKGTQRGTVTGSDGGYELIVPDTATVLIFSFVGFLMQEIRIDNRSSLDVTMITDQKSLEELVVVGYGSQRKKDITAAVSVINVKDIGGVPPSNFTRLLQGQAAGVVATQRSGTPGEPFTVRVRGVSSLGAGSDPLYVIDGFPVGTSIGQNVNPHDIESISVLKDAAATAIYGARGSNGVILITTKTGKEGKAALSLSVDYGVQNLPDSRKVKVLTGPEFAQFKYEVFSDRFLFDKGRLPEPNEIPEGIRHPEQVTHTTNWYDAILNSNAPYTDVNLNMTAGAGPLKSMLSVGYYKEAGALIATNYDRLSVRSNLQGTVNKFITMGINLNGSYVKTNYASTNGRDAIAGSSLLLDPREPMYDDKGVLRPYIIGKDGVFAYPNPVFALQNIDRNTGIAELLGNGFIELSLAKGLKFRSSVNTRLKYDRNSQFVPSTIGVSLASGSAGAPPRIANASESNTQLANVSTDQLLTYFKEFEGGHQVDLMAGVSAQKEKVKALFGNGSDFPDDLVPYLGVAAIRSAGSLEYDWSILAYLARANYSYKDKYLLSATFRREGSSRFGSNTKFGNFPAISAGWRISDEPFMPKTNWLTDLKLRGSWGVTGNNDIGNYTHLAFMRPENYIINNTIAPGKVVESFANADLKWETSNKLDIGLDLALFDNQLVLTAEWYKQITRDMLFSIPVPSASGFTSVWTNLGRVENKGVELAANYRVKIGGVNLRTNANITFNRSKILELRGEDTTPIWSGSFYGGQHVQKIGRPIGMLYGYRKLGIFNTKAEIEASPLQDGAIPGSMKFWDADGNGEVTYDTQDMVEIGNPNPDFTWAWTVAADYKRFDLNFMFTGAQNYEMYRAIEASTMNMDGVFNVLDKAKDRWRSPENPGSNPGHKNSQGGTNFWKWGRESSDRYIYDASHAWLKNVTLGYTLASRNTIFRDARIFFSVTNLFLITKYPGNNPEANQRNERTEMGFDDESYPVPRTMAGGIRINF